MQREREAVDSEFQMCLPSDYNRSDIFLYSCLIDYLVPRFTSTRFLLFVIHLCSVYQTNWIFSLPKHGLNFHILVHLLFPGPFKTTFGNCLV